MFCDIFDRIGTEPFFTIFSFLLNRILHSVKLFVRKTVSLYIIEQRHPIMIFLLISIREPLQILWTDHLSITNFQSFFSCCLNSTSLNSLLFTDTELALLESFSFSFSFSFTNNFSIFFSFFRFDNDFSPFFISSYELPSSFFDFSSGRYNIVLSIIIVWFFLIITGDCEIKFIDFINTFFKLFNNFSSNFDSARTIFNSWLPYPDPLESIIDLWFFFSIFHIHYQFIVILNSHLIEIIDRIFNIIRVSDRHES